MVWDPTHPVTNGAVVSEPLRDNFAALDTALVAPLTALTNNQILVKAAGPIVTGVAPGTNGEVLTMVAGVPTWESPPSSDLAIMNVKDFGAVGDGAADDTAAIQAAIDAVKGTAQVPPFNSTGSVFIPAGKYLLSAPLNLYSGIMVRGAGATSLLKAGGGFVGTRILNLATTGTYYAGGVVEDLGFESAGGTGIAAIQPDAATAIVVDNVFTRLWLNTAQGLLLNVYTQATVIDGIVSHGPIDTIVHLKGNWNHIGNINKEGLTGSSTAPYIWIEDHAASHSSGNVLDRLLIEGTTSVNKSAIVLDGVDETLLRNVWWEPTASNGYLLRVANSRVVHIGGQLHALHSTTGKVKIDTTELVTFEHFSTDAQNVSPWAMLEIDSTSRASFASVRSRIGTDLGRLDLLDRNVVVAQHFGTQIFNDAAAGHTPASLPRYAHRQNLLQNPSFEAGRYGWTFSLAPTTTEAYVTSEVGPGLMLQAAYSATALYYLYQTITVPTEWVGRPLTWTALVKVTGADVTKWATPFASGAGVTNINGYNKATPGAGWVLITETLIPQSAGTLQVGLNLNAAVGITFYIDEVCLAFGTEAAPNPAKWASYELNGQTITTAPAIPTTGTWKVGDLVWNSGPGTAGWKCTAAGTPGTWAELAPGASALTYPLGAPDGTAAAPSYSFTSDPDVGLFRPAANALGIGPAPGTLRLYNLYTDASNGEWFNQEWTTAANWLRTYVAANGAGTVRSWQLRYGGNTGTAITIGTGLSGGLSLSGDPNQSVAVSTGRVQVGGTGHTATSGTHVGMRIVEGVAPTATSALTLYPLYLNSTINYANATPGGGAYEALKIAMIETALPTGQSYMIRASGGAAGTTDVFAVTRDGAIKMAVPAVPGTPPAGYGMLYMKADKKLYFKNDAAVETALW